MCMRKNNNNRNTYMAFENRNLLPIRLWMGELQFILRWNANTIWRVCQIILYYTGARYVQPTNNQNIENDPYTRIAFMVHAYAHPYTYAAHTSDGNVERMWLTCVLCMAKHLDCVWCDRTLLLLSYHTILSCYALRYPHETHGAQLNRLERAMR